MKKKKVMSVVLAAIMTVGLLSGCGTSKESRKESSITDPCPIKISLW